MDEITDRQETEELDAVYATASASARPDAPVVASHTLPRRADLASAFGDARGLVTDMPGLETQSQQLLEETVSPNEGDVAERGIEAEPTSRSISAVTEDASETHREAVAPISISARIPLVEALAPQIEPQPPVATTGAMGAIPAAPDEPAVPADAVEVADTAAEAEPAIGIAQPPAPERPSSPEPSALIIPFVPRGGALREGAAGAVAAPSAQPFARQPIPYFISPADGGPALAPQPAVPPPPSGFRRSADWVRSPAQPAAAAPAPLVAPPLVAPVPMPEASAPTGETATGRQGLNARLLVKRIFQVLGGLLAGYAVVVVALILAYRWIDPPMSALMLGQRISGTEVSQKWMPLDRIAPSLQLAVVLSEDGRFCSHRGVDWGELREAIEQSLDGVGARGGSTISMQTVKNLFLWPSKSYVRKAVEIPLAMGTEAVWPKARMLEIYLNIAEWGPGVFGAEAAARYHFGKSASALSPREASLLAVSLPNPFDRQAGSPGPGTQRLADTLQGRMRRVPNAAACGSPGRPSRPGIADRRWP